MSYLTQNALGEGSFFFCPPQLGEVVHAPALQFGIAVGASLTGAANSELPPWLTCFSSPRLTCKKLLKYRSLHIGYCRIAELLSWAGRHIQFPTGCLEESAIRKCYNLSLSHRNSQITGEVHCLRTDRPAWICDIPLTYQIVPLDQFVAPRRVLLVSSGQWDTCGHMRHIHILTQLTEAIPLTKMPLKYLSPNTLDSNSLMSTGQQLR